MSVEDNDLTEMEYVRAALANAYHSNVSLHDIMQVSIHAKTGQEFDTAVNLLACASYNGEENGNLQRSS